MFTHLLILAIAAQAAPIEGQVIDARNRSALPMAKVELFHMLAPITWQITNRDGRFSFGHLSEGRYTISVAYDGYETASADIQMDGASFPILIQLVRKKTAPLTKKPVVSVQQLMTPSKARKEFDLARKYVRQEECDKAVDHFENGLRAFDRDAAAHNDLGNCYRKLNRFDSAENAFKRALSLSDSAYVSLNLAEVYAAQKRFNEAETILADNVRKHADSGDAYYGLAAFYFEHGRLEEAFVPAMEAEKRSHQIPDVHLILAEIYWKKRDSAAAAEHLQLYLKEAPRGPKTQSAREALDRIRN